MWGTVNLGYGAAPATPNGFSATVNPAWTAKAAPGIIILHPKDSRGTLTVTSGPSVGDVLSLQASTSGGKQQYNVDIQSGPHRGESYHLCHDLAARKIQVLSNTTRRSYEYSFTDGNGIITYIEMARNGVIENPSPAIPTPAVGATLADEAKKTADTVVTPAKRVMQAAKAILEAGGEVVKETALDKGIGCLDKTGTVLSFVSTLGAHAPNGEISKMSFTDTIEAVCDFGAKKVVCDGAKAGAALGAAVVFGPVGGFTAGLAAGIVTEQAYDSFLKDGVNRCGKNFSKFVVELSATELEMAKRDEAAMATLVKNVGQRVKGLLETHNPSKSAVPIEFELTTGTGMRVRDERYIDGKQISGAYVDTLPKASETAKCGDAPSTAQKRAREADETQEPDKKRRATEEAPKEKASASAKSEDEPPLAQKRAREADETQEPDKKRRATEEAPKEKAHEPAQASLSFGVALNLIHDGESVREEVQELHEEIAEKTRLIEECRLKAAEAGVPKGAIDAMAAKEKADLLMAGAAGKIADIGARAEIHAGRMLDAGLQDLSQKLSALPSSAVSSLGGNLASAIAHPQQYSSVEDAAIDVTAKTAVQLGKQAVNSVVDSAITAVAAEVLGKTVAKNIPGVGTAIAAYEAGKAVLSANTVEEGAARATDIGIKTFYSTSGAILGQAFIPIPLVGAGLGAFLGSLLGEGLAMVRKDMTG